MQESEKTSRILLRYSFPCGKILLSEGVISDEDYDLLTKAIAGIEEFPLSKFVEHFIVVSDGVDIKGDEEEIRRYFWYQHNSNIRPSHCLTVPGIVVKSEPILVRNLFTDAIIDATPLIDVREGDYVILHLNHIVDKVSEKDVRDLLGHLRKLEFDETSKRLDKIMPAKVLGIIEGRDKAIVDDGNGERVVNIKLVKEGLKVGDMVLIHYTHAFKTVTNEQAKMFR